MKSDFFRYCYLYEKAGLYADSDLRCLQDFGPLTAGLDRGLLVLRPLKGRGKSRCLSSLMIIKRPHDPLLAVLIDTAVQNIENRCSNNIWEVTGPGILTELYRAQTPAASALLADFTFVRESEIRAYVEFHSKLEYKKMELHWTVAQKNRSIFSS
jgi:mannosyltransferase OCH1-like enzyme